MEKLIDREVPAASVFSGPYYFLEQLGFRKVIDSTFMMAIDGHRRRGPGGRAQVFPRLAARAARHRSAAGAATRTTTRKNFPQRFRDQMDTRRWGPGERIVFEPYTSEAYEEAREWIAGHGIFVPGEMGSGRYEDAILAVAP